MSIISFSHVSKKYAGDVTALSEISLDINEGELVFLTGPSGAGKSTLLKLIAGMEKPSGGMLQVSGQDMRKLNRTTLPFLRRKLGLIMQQQRLLNDRNVLANVILPLIISGATTQEAKERATVALERVGMMGKAQALPKTLSGGEQQRVSIARAVVHKPRIILADEPTATLDRENGRMVLDMIEAFNRAGVTCVISTHDDRLLQDADRIVQLTQGKLIGIRSSDSEVGA
jgi:cell division transport system ATP-binding protein